MKLKQLIQVMATSLTFLTVAASVHAQTYPSKAIKIIVPAPPGGAIDIIARVVGDKLSASMGQPVIIDNKPGASNNLGTDVLAKSPPDGYTIGIVGGSHNINKFLFKNLGWDPEKSFEPIVYTHVVPLVFAIHPQIPAKNLPEFIAWMKAIPEQAYRKEIPTTFRQSWVALRRDVGQRTGLILVASSIGAVLIYVI